MYRLAFGRNLDNHQVATLPQYIYFGRTRIWNPNPGWPLQ